VLFLAGASLDERQHQARIRPSSALPAPRKKQQRQQQIAISPLRHDIAARLPHEQNAQSWRRHTVRAFQHSPTCLCCTTVPTRPFRPEPGRRIIRLLETVRRQTDNNNNNNNRRETQHCSHQPAFRGPSQPGWHGFKGLSTARTCCCLKCGFLICISPGTAGRLPQWAII
jgi:hypothetical protein